MRAGTPSRHKGQGSARGESRDAANNSKSRRPWGRARYKGTAVAHNSIPILKPLGDSLAGLRSVRLAFPLGGRQRGEIAIKPLAQKYLTVAEFARRRDEAQTHHFPQHVLRHAAAIGRRILDIEPGREKSRGQGTRFTGFTHNEAYAFSAAHYGAYGVKRTQNSRMGKSLPSGNRGEKNECYFITTS